MSLKPEIHQKDKIRLNSKVKTLIIIGLSSCLVLSTIIFSLILKSNNESLKQLMIDHKKLDVKFHETNELLLSEKNINTKLRNKINYMKNESSFKAVSAEKEHEIIVAYIKKSNPKCDPNIADMIAKTILSKSKEHKVMHFFVIPIIHVESTFNPFAVSSKGARGLMQVMPDINAKKFNKYKLHEIEYGIDAGITVLKEKFDLNKNDILKSIRAYNGIGTPAEEFRLRVLEKIAEFLMFRDLILSEMIAVTKPKEESNMKNLDEIHYESKLKQGLQVIY